MDLFSYSSLKSALEDLYPGDPLMSRGAGGGGGCINVTSTMTLKSGLTLFLKENSKASSTMFPEEARGLSVLREAFPLHIPRPLAFGSDKGTSFLLLEYIREGSKPTGFWQDFGRALAEMHNVRLNQSYGFSSNNFIGSTVQVNDLMERWTDFFAEKRLLYQVELARTNGLADRTISRGVESICSRITELLPEPGHPSLLHGDLWGGNYMVDEKGHAVLIDPAVYFGHREADLAMTELFGGFKRDFYRAYEEISPLVPGYGKRRDLYNLYHMLNHLNLFGPSYRDSVRSIILQYT